MLGCLLASDWLVKQIDLPFSHSCDPLLAQVPQEIVLPEPVTQVAAGHHHTLFLTESGNVWACGRNSRGQLGLGSKAGSFATIPQRLDALTGVFVRMHKGVCNLGAYTRLLHISCIWCRASPINQSNYIYCLYDSSGKSTDNNWENNIH